MMQFFKNKLLQFIGGLALLGVNTGLRQQHLRINRRLLKQQTKAVVFGRQRLLRC